MYLEKLAGIPLKVPAKTRYATLALMVLSRTYPNNNFIPTRVISGQAGIPEKYVIQIFQLLRGKGIVVSQQGKEGGYRLARTPDKISLYEVFLAVQGNFIEIEEKSDEMQTPDGITIRSAILSACNKAQSILEEINFEKLVEISDGNRDGSFMYHI